VAKQTKRERTATVDEVGRNHKALREEPKGGGVVSFISKERGFIEGVVRKNK